MSREKYYEKVLKERYSCHACSLPFPEIFTSEDEKNHQYSIILDGERLDFHKRCLFEHLKETWIPYSN